MTCEEAWILINGHLDQENTPAEEAQLQEHLEHCSQCREWMEVMEGCDEAIRSLEAEPPADLCANVMEAIRQEKPKKRHPWTRWAGGAVAAALLLAVGLSRIPAKQEQEAPNVMTARAVPEVDGYGAASALDCSGVSENQIQELADERTAGIVMLQQSVPELMACDREELPNGSVLYALDDETEAQALRDEYQLSWYEPMNGTPEQYYALLLP